jgi:hypothetical protein
MDGRQSQKTDKTWGIKMRKPFKSAIGALLCIAFASLVVACAKDDVAPTDVEKQAFEDLRTVFRVAITDPAREAETIRLVGVLEEDLAALRSSVTARKARTRELNANYDTPRAEFEAFLAKMEAEIRDNRQRVSNTHQALLATVTAEEISSVAKSHTKAMIAAIETLQAI